MYKRILVPLDGSATAKLGLAEAIGLAKQQHATLRLLHVVDQAVLVSFPEPAMYGAEMIEALEQQGRTILTDAEAVARRHKIKVDTVLHTRLARAADVIVKQARDWRADLIVLGTHGRRGIDRLLMGSDAELVVRNSPVPVLLVRSRKRARRRSGR
jgi:nucleotide-binding universal stress UspA family protein